jgi:radical SAM protein with 4Fe4S-binding SPASM domain
MPQGYHRGGSFFMLDPRFAKHLPQRFGLKEGAEDLPLMILPQVSNICNSNCPHCWFTANPELRKRDGIPFMSGLLLRRIIDEVAQSHDPQPLIRVTGTGEPFLMPELTDLLVYGCAEKSIRAAVITNGSLLTPERSARLIDSGIEALEISADAADSKTYRRIRPGLNFQVLMDNIQHMVRYRNRTGAKTKILVSFVENSREIDPDAVEAFWAIRVDNVIRRKYLTYGQTSEDYYSKDTYLPPDQRVPCPYPFERMVITANGNVTFCNFDVEDGYYVGNVQDDSISGIWRGTRFEAWRKLVLEGRFEDMPLCCKCNDWKYKSWTHNFFKVLNSAGREKKTVP